MYCVQKTQIESTFSKNSKIETVCKQFCFTSFWIIGREFSKKGCCVTMIKAQTSVADKEKIENINLKLEEPKDGKFEIIRNKGHEWNVKASKFAKKTTNPIRAIVEHLNVQPNPEKSFIPLSVGKSYK